MSNSHLNLFTLLRLCLSCGVLVGHHYQLSGFSPPSILGVTIHILSVYCFFSISGFLIVQSYTRSSSLSQFFLKRLVRIAPGYYVSLFVVTFFVGPICTTVPLSAYFLSPQIYQFFLFNGIGMIHFYLPEVFTGNPVSAAVNGSIWSLPVEVILYLITPLYIKICSIRRYLCFLLIGVHVGLFIGVINDVIILPVYYTIDLTQIVTCGMFYVAGGLLTLRPKYLKVRIAALLISLLFLFSAVQPIPSYIFYFALPYVVNSFGAARLSVGRKIPAFDYSYGIYLYAFPIQQALISLFPELTFLVGIILALFLTTVLASMSWHLVEARLLSYSKQLT